MPDALGDPTPDLWIESSDPNDSPGPGPDPLDASSIVLTAGNEQIDLGLVGAPLPADARAFVFYMTLDLTGVAVASGPAFRLSDTHSIEDSSRLRLPRQPLRQVLMRLTQRPLRQQPPKGLPFLLHPREPPISGGGRKARGMPQIHSSQDQFNRNVPVSSLHPRPRRARHGWGPSSRAWGSSSPKTRLGGLQNWDQDVPYVVPIHSGVGCVTLGQSPWDMDISSGFRKGWVYLWDGAKADLGRLGEVQAHVRSR